MYIFAGDGSVSIGYDNFLSLSGAVFMRISSHFSTVDDAEFAAAAIRRNMDGIFDISITENPTNAHRDTAVSPMGIMNPMGVSSGMAGAPVSPAYNISGTIGKAYSEAYSEKNYFDNSKSAELNVICRKASASRVSGVIRSKGGYNLKAM